MAVHTKGAWIEYVGGGGGAGERRVFKFFKKEFHSPGDHRPKYFMLQ